MRDPAGGAAVPPSGYGPGAAGAAAGYPEDQVLGPVLDSLNDAFQRIAAYMADLWEPLVATDAVSLTAAGAGTLGFMCPLGYRWEVTNLAYDSSAGTPALKVYIGDSGQDAFRLVDHSPAAATNISDRSSPIYVSQGVFLVLVFSGGSNAAVETATIHGRRYSVPQGGASVGG